MPTSRNAVPKPALLQKCVGNKRPPEEHQFRKGVSGNPRGRPRKPKPDSIAGQTSIHDQVLADSQLPVTIKQNEEVVGTLPTDAAVLRRMRSAALEGNGIALRRYLRVMQAARDQKQKEQLAAMQAMADYVRRCEAKIASCTAEDEEAPDFLPHPHDVVIDLERGEIKINGPATEAEKMLWEQAELDRQAKSELIKELFLTANDPLCEFRIGDVEAVIRENMEEIVKLDRVFPSADTRRQAGFDLEEHRRQKDKAVISLPPDNRRRKIKKRTCPAAADPRQMPCVKDRKAAARHYNEGGKMRQTSSPADSIADLRKRNIARNAAAIISQAKAQVKKTR